VQECGAGLVRIRREGDVPAFAAPPLQRSGPLDETDVDRIAAGLGLTRSDIVDHQWCDNGPGWMAVLLESADQVLSISPDPHLLAGLDVGVIGPHSSGDVDYEVRAFFPGNSGLTEDPVTGSLNAALAQWLIGSDRAPEVYLAAQGTAMGRAGRVHVMREGDDVWIGGRCVTVIAGEVSI
jgi:PhzF family phenazine biosynthesis protein